MKRNITERINKEVDATCREILPVVERDIRTIFIKVVSAFYDDYTPITYDRSWSLPALLVTELDKEKRSLNYDFDPTAMSSFHNGYDGDDGLYNQVFRHGWHGGADKIRADKAEKYGAHPEPGVPYWREPIPYYTRWGSKAKVADISPLDDFNERLAKYEQGELRDKFERLLLEHLQNIKFGYYM